jgi:hypothetical protein
MPEQIGSAMWLGLGFTCHPTVFSALVTLPFQPTTLRTVTFLSFHPTHYLQKMTQDENNHVHDLPPLRTSGVPSFAKAEPNSQFRGIYICNNL